MVLYTILMHGYLLNPEIYNGRLVNVEVEVNSELTRGMTVGLVECN